MDFKKRLIELADSGVINRIYFTKNLDGTIFKCRETNGNTAYEVRSSAGKSCFVYKEFQNKAGKYYFKIIKGAGCISTDDQFKKDTLDAVTDIVYPLRIDNLEEPKLPLVIFEFGKSRLLDIKGAAKVSDLKEEEKNYDIYKGIVRTPPIVDTIPFSHKTCKRCLLPFEKQTISEYIDRLNIPKGTKEELEFEKLIDKFDREWGTAYLGQSNRLFRNCFRVMDMEIFLKEKSYDKLRMILDFSKEIMELEFGKKITDRLYLKLFSKLIGEQVGKIISLDLVQCNRGHRQDITLAGEVCDLDIIKTRNKDKYGYYMQLLTFAGHIKPLIDSIIGIIGLECSSKEHLDNLKKEYEKISAKDFTDSLINQLSEDKCKRFLDEFSKNKEYVLKMFNNTTYKRHSVCDIDSFNNNLMLNLENFRSHNIIKGSNYQDDLRKNLS